MKRLHPGLILMGIIAIHGSASACDICSSLAGINPYYSTSDNILFHVLFQSSRHTPAAASTGTGGSKTVALNHLNAYPGTLPEPYHNAHGTEATRESRTTFELGYQHHFSENLLAMGRLPYVLISEESGGGRSNARGTGDPSLLLYYVVKDFLPDDLTSTLLIGGGAKLPLGTTGLRDNRGTPLDPRMQPGSGSTDLLLNAVATVRFADWIAAMDINGKINGSNQEHTRLGNSATISTSLARDLYRNSNGDIALLGAAGARAEMMGDDRIGGAIEAGTGFTTTYGSLGGTFIYGRAKLDFTVLLPLSQHRADGSADENTRLLVGTRWEL